MRFWQFSGWHLNPGVTRDIWRMDSTIKVGKVINFIKMKDRFWWRWHWWQERWGGEGGAKKKMKVDKFWSRWHWLQGKGRGARFHQILREKAEQVVTFSWWYYKQCTQCIAQCLIENIFSGGSAGEQEGHRRPLWQCSRPGEMTFGFREKIFRFWK